MASIGLKSSHFTCFCTEDGLGSFLEKVFFDTFWSQNKLFSNNFGVAKMACNGLQKGSFDLLRHPK